MGLLSDNAITELVQWAINKFSLSKHSHEKSEVTGLEEALNGKAATSHKHTKSQITDFPTIPTKTSQLTNDSGYITKVEKTTLTDLGITATAAELNYCDGVTSNIQTQLNAKASSTHTHETINNGLMAIPLDSSAVIYWRAVEGAIKYRVQRQNDEGTYTTIVYPAANVTSYYDSGLTNGKTYNYRVYYYDEAENLIQIGAITANPAKGAGSSVICGQFSGTGAAQTINIGVTPKAVFVGKAIGGSDVEVAYNGGVSKQANGTVRLEVVTNGFTAGYGIYTTGTVYFYIALV